MMNFLIKKIEKEMKKIDDNNVKENEDSLFQNNLSKKKFTTREIENGKI